MNIQLDLSGLHCKACVGRVSEALKPLCSEVDVTLSPMQATISGAKVSTEKLIKAVKAAGKYDATAIEAVSPSSAVTPQRLELDPVSSLPQAGLSVYKPLLILTAFLIFVPALALFASGALTWMGWMQYFMAGFFLAFSFFKLLDIRAFADAYAGYDLLAARWKPWGLIYPFVELALGLAYLIGFNPLLTNLVTIVVMGFSLAGVIIAVNSKKTIRCACLGAVFNLPMSSVTIIEDGLMVIMAAAMLLS